MYNQRMNEAKLTKRGEIPCFLAISRHFRFMASICGFAISRALSMVIAPVMSQSLILSSSSLSFITLSYNDTGYNARGIA